jgi:hypothetical protein
MVDAAASEKPASHSAATDDVASYLKKQPNAAPATGSLFE